MFLDQLYHKRSFRSHLFSHFCEIKLINSTDFFFTSVHESLTFPLTNNFYPIRFQKKWQLEMTPATKRNLKKIINPIKEIMMSSYPISFFPSPKKNGGEV